MYIPRLFMHMERFVSTFTLAKKQGICQCIAVYFFCVYSSVSLWPLVANCLNDAREKTCSCFSSVR
jgi:hypothetical protein